MLKQTIVCLLAGGLSLSAAQALSQSSYSYFSADISSHCQMTHGLFSLDKQCIKKNAATYQGLNNQQKYLRRTYKPNKTVTTAAAISRSQLVSSIDALIKWHNGDAHLADHFEIRGLQGERGNDKVKMTGYYTPILSASRFRSERYQHPIYRTPMGSRRLLSREQIASGALEGLDLEIAWVEDPIDLFYSHIQGSVILQFPRGEQRLLSVAKTNEQPFYSISNYMQQRGFLTGHVSRRTITQWLQEHPTYLNEVLSSNPRYVFYREDDRLSTASGLDLIAGHTVAVDTKHIPFGSVLLAEVPVSQAYNGKPVYEWRLLFPQDRGIDIKGAARLDLYTGKGKDALEVTHKVTGARRVYLLLSKPNTQLAVKG